MSRPLRLLAVLVVAAGAVALAVALVGGDRSGPVGGPELGSSASDRSGAADDRTEFLGLVQEELVVLPRRRLERTLDHQGRLRVGVIRQTFRWAEVEREPGRFDFARYDPLMEAAAARGIRILPVLFDPPPFRSSRPARGARRGTYPPRRPADMGAFAAAAVRRYGPRGTFWRDRPELRKVPIRDWQVWNEPSLPVYWPDGPDPAAYTRLLRATAEAIRRSDPRARIVSAGLSQTRAGIPFERFVREMYRAGAAAAFDVLAIHPYARDAAGAVRAVRRTRRLMDETGDRSPLWVTELGWASGGPPSDFTVGERGQAERIGATLVALAELRGSVRLRGVVYFAWKDAPVYPGGSDFWGLHTGLLPIAGRPKPAFEAFEDAAERIARMPGLRDR